MFKNFRLYCILLLSSLVLILSSCDNSPDSNRDAMQHVAQPATHISDQDVNQFNNTNNKNYIESVVMIERLGDSVYVRVPSSLFFKGNSANLSSNFNKYMSQLVGIVKRYDHNSMNIAVKFPVDVRNNSDYQIASNQADRFVTRLEQHLRSRFSIGHGDLVVKSTSFTPDIAKLGNYFEIILALNS